MRICSFLIFLQFIKYVIFHNNNNYYHFTALWTLSRTTRVSRYQKKRSPTHNYHGHQSSLIYFLHLLRSMAFSLVYLLAWHLPLHTPYISSPNHCLLFTAHDHTIAAWFAVVPKLCHLILVLSQPFTLYLVA